MIHDRLVMVMSPAFLNIVGCRYPRLRARHVLPRIRNHDLCHISNRPIGWEWSCILTGQLCKFMHAVVGGGSARFARNLFSLSSTD